MQREQKDSVLHIILSIILLAIIVLGTYFLISKGVLPAALFLSSGSQNAPSASSSTQSSQASAPTPAPIPTTTPQPTPTPVPTPIPTPAPAQTTSLLKDSFKIRTTKGSVTIAYELAYPIPEVIATTIPGDHSLITIAEGARTHTIQLFSNFDANIPSSADVWQLLRVDRMCSTCAATTTTLMFSAASDITTYANATEEVIIYLKDSVYVIMHIQKPDAAIRNYLKNFKVNAGISA